MAGHLRSLLSRGWPLALALYLLAAGYAIHAHGPLPLYSTRSLSVAWEMWLRGEFIVPQLNGAAYAHKVPLLYWLVHAGWAVGGVSDTWPRVLMLLIGSANLLLLAWFTRRLQPGAPRAAALAPWLLLGCAFWFVYSLQVLFDGLLACWVLLALGALLRGGPATPRPQWWLYSLAVAAGLLTKGPVMLLHVVPALLLAPWWSASVRAAPGRWYAHGLLALVVAGALFALWLLPALQLGGPAYRGELLWTQTAGRVVRSFDHARPWWWYLAALPVLALPWLLWPRAWGALRNASWRADPALRFLLAWLLSALLAFSLVSGKQAYYVVPELAGFAALLALLLAREGERGRPWLWPFALGLVVLGLVLVLVPRTFVANGSGRHWLHDLLGGDLVWGAGVSAVGIALWLGGARDGVHAAIRLAVAMVGMAVLVHGLFSQALWHDYNLQPTADRLAALQAEGREVAHLGIYEGQYQFLGRLRQPLEPVAPEAAAAWARDHPEGVIVEVANHLEASHRAQPLLLQPFRGEWVEVWYAMDWRYAHGLGELHKPPHPTEISPKDYDRARDLIQP